MEFEEATGDESTQNRWSDFSSAFVKKASSAETGFLSLLRFAALLIAALVLIGSIIFLGLGFFKQIGPTKVEAESVSVSANEIIPPPVNTSKTDTSNKTLPVVDKKVGISQNVRRETLTVFKNKFKKYQRADAKITEQQVVDFIWSEDRIEKYNTLAGQLFDADDKVLADQEAVMLNAIRATSTANGTDEFRKQLSAYKDAKKSNVCTNEERTRSQTVDSWDSTSTYCAGWYVSPVGCPSKRTITEPYTEKVCTMKFPEGLETPEQQFSNAIQRYADEAVAKLEGAQLDAASKTTNNEARKAEGWANLFTSGQMFLGFLFVMFLYLFVAIERHHQTLSKLMKARE